LKKTEKMCRASEKAKQGSKLFSRSSEQEEETVDKLSSRFSRNTTKLTLITYTLSTVIVIMKITDS
jgi:hypothetical protein